MWETGSALPALLVAPEFIWEAFLGIYCAIRGFPATLRSFRRVRTVTSYLGRVVGRIIST